ncbi:lysin B [Mycobacterium phage Hawkeye]|uniref:Lysin B n=1 Tax=Mycobacterium phage Hawkeye TaxID=1458711 RepID=X2KYV0_9CAUD|nr:lysin B [Mycobacterium phage Hawkeye]AHN84054.1 lysin B [Mycobacterium phage Hawkeye]
MIMGLPYKKGSNGPEILVWQNWAYRYAPSYASVIGPKDAYFGNGEDAFVRQMQFRLGIPVTGIFDQMTAEMTGFKPGSVVVSPPVIKERRKIWFYSNAGSGADWNVGPSFEIGELCKNILKINHQPVSSAIGGYLGLLGGDAKLSYNDVVYDQYKSIEWLLDNNIDISDKDLELWFSGYSQKADGLEDALEILFGDGGFRIPKTGEVTGPGKYRHLRSRINGVIQIGNPSRQPGATKVSGNPPGWGIARKKRPDWLKALIFDIVAQSPGAPDFYAACDDEIRPLFYEWFTKAETELPFVVYTAQIIIPALLNLVAPFLGALGGVASPLAGGILAGATGLPMNIVSSMLSGVIGSTEPPNPKLIELLSIKGLLTNIPQLIHLLTQVSGVQTHGEYHLPKPEFNGRTGIQVGYDVVAGFRR